MKLPIPHLTLHNALDLAPETLRDMGIRLLLLDLDNTLSPYHLHHPDEKLTAWIKALKDMGIEPFILSNNKGPRPQLFARALEVDFAGKARKPLTRVLHDVLTRKGVNPKHAALMGDQIYTDVLCARSAGITAILVRPISLDNPLLAVRYALEVPFRLINRGRCAKK